MFRENYVQLWARRHLGVRCSILRSQSPRIFQLLANCRSADNSATAVPSLRVFVLNPVSRETMIWSVLCATGTSGCFTLAVHIGQFAAMSVPREKHNWSLTKGCAVETDGARPRMFHVKQDNADPVPSCFT
jgi:hypothetical protein